jgi:hypothetical protein
MKSWCICRIGAPWVGSHASRRPPACCRRGTEPHMEEASPSLLWCKAIPTYRRQNFATHSRVSCPQWMNSPWFCSLAQVYISENDSCCYAGWPCWVGACFVSYSCSQAITACGILSNALYIALPNLCLAEDPGV